MRSPVVVVAAVAMVLVAACERRTLSYQTSELPGFSMALPNSPDMGGVGTTAQRSYGAGTIKRGQGRSPMHVVSVAWQVGVLSTDEEVLQLIDIMAAALVGKLKPEQIGTPRRDTIGGQPAVRVEFRVAPLDLELVEIVCGARTILITVGADDPRAILDRMLASFSCDPDPAREAELAPGRAPVGLDDLRGWHRTDDAGDGFMITDDVTVAYFAAVPDARALDQIGFPKMLAAMMEVSMGSWTELDTVRVTRHGHTRDVVFGRTTVEGDEARLGAATWSCPTGPPVFGFAIDTSAEPASDAAREATIDVLLRARCLRPGEEPPTFEPAAADQ